jgi:hypothetical protein
MFAIAIPSIDLTLANITPLRLLNKCREALYIISIGEPSPQYNNSLVGICGRIIGLPSPQ